MSQSIHVTLVSISLALISLAAAEPSAQTENSPETLVCNRIRFFPRSGFSQRMNGGKFQGSNSTPTSGFVDLATIEAAPPEGKWSELRFKNAAAYRYLRYFAPAGSWGNVAELEFYHGDAKLNGKPFGTFGSRNDGGNTFDKAFDGNTTTFYDAPLENDQYLGVELTEVAAQGESPEITSPVKTGGGHRHFHIGNSLTDTEGEFTQAIAHAAGYSDDFFDRNTMPGCPIHAHWKIRAEKRGFGTPSLEACIKDAPLTDLVLQVFVQNGDSADPVPLVGFYDVFKAHSPDVRLWVYGQWPDIGKANPAVAAPRDWETQAVALMRIYYVAAHNAQSQRSHTPPVGVIPGGLALLNLKHAIEQGKVPGWSNFHSEMFADGIHLTANGRYFIGLVHYACLYGKSPVGLPAVSLPGEPTKLTPEQTRILEQIAWESVMAFRNVPEKTVAVSVPAEIDTRDHLYGLPPHFAAPYVTYIPANSDYVYLVCPRKPGKHLLKVSVRPESQKPEKLKVLLNDDPAGTSIVLPANEGRPWYVETAALALNLKAGVNFLCLQVPNQRPFTLNSIRITDAQGQGVAHTLPQSDCMLPIIEVTPESAFTHLLQVKDEQGETEKIAITAESDNPAVIPVDAISVETGDFAGQWGYRGNRKITVKHSGHAGTATVRWTLTSAAGVRREFYTNVTCK